MSAERLLGPLARHAAERPGKAALIFLGDGEAETERITFTDLEERSKAAGALLTERGLRGKPVLIVHPPGVAFAVAFWGCLQAGAIATPAPTAGRGQKLNRMTAIARNADVAAVMGPDDHPARVPGGVLGALAWITPAEARASIEGESRPAASDEPVLLQYTSGSLSDPKGVIVTSGALADNLWMVRRSLRLDEDGLVFSWLPLFHDMGLISAFLAAIHAGVTCVLSPPEAFIQKPERWLRGISRYRATFSGAPNFAFALCARRAAAMDLGSLDLSCWTSAYCGAEPIRRSSLDAFARTFAKAGFRPEALIPCYGLAEATLIVSGGPGGVRTLAFEGREVVGCGVPAAGVSVAIVDPESGLRRPDGTEGEIWVASPSLAPGYWRADAQDAAAFDARLDGSPARHLRTGDLGLMHEGELYVTGRRKDLIIYRGANIHPADIEQSIAESDPRFLPAGAAFELDDGEVVAVHEVERGVDPAELDAMVARAVRAVAEACGLRLFDLVLVRPRGVPRTTSGKVQRGACKALYLNGAIARRGDAAHPLFARAAAATLTRRTG